ncbi:DMT family transporter [Halanaerobaculum tunisiense]
MEVIYYLLPIIAGAAVTMQVGLNSNLGSIVNNPLLSSLVSFIVGSLGLGIILILNIINGIITLPSLQNCQQTNWWMWLGGLFGALYIFTTTFISPKIGFANMFSLVIAGQMILAMLLDHFGILRNTIHTINPLRILGIILLIIGVYLIQAN